jgi:hypothetical protein
MTALESLDAPLVLVLTRDSVKSIPSQEALLALLRIYILKLPMGLIRDIEQRARLSQKLCDGYHEIFEENGISVFPAPLSTRQHDTRTLAPRHLAHLVSATVPQFEPAKPRPTPANESLTQIHDESAEDLSQELPSHELSAPSPDGASLLIDAAPLSDVVRTDLKPASSASPWRRFLQALRLALALIAFTISLATLSPIEARLPRNAPFHESRPPKLRQGARNLTWRPATKGTRRDLAHEEKADRFPEQERLDQEETKDRSLEKPSTRDSSWSSPAFLDSGVAGFSERFGDGLGPGKSGLGSADSNGQAQGAARRA